MATDLQDTVLLDRYPAKYLSRIGLVLNLEEVVGMIWKPARTTLPVASQACLELVKRSCKSIKGCSNSCSCKKANWTLQTQLYEVNFISALALLKFTSVAVKRLRNATAK